MWVVCKKKKKIRGELVGLGHVVCREVLNLITYELSKRIIIHLMDVSRAKTES